MSLSSRKRVPPAGVLLSSILLILAIFCFEEGLSAQEEKGGEKKDFFKMSIEELMEVPVETVVGASKYEQKTSEAPSSVTIVTADDIRKFGYRTLADILGSAQGFYATSDRNYSYIGVRGFGRPGDYNSRILVLVDGVRANENVYDGAGAEGSFPLDTALIDRVEIIRGPGSSLYGSNAFFAVVNVITRKGSDLDGVQVAGEAASHFSFKERLSYGKKYDDGLEVLFSLSNFSSRGQDLYFKEFDSPATNNGVAADSDSEKFHNFFSKLSYGDFTFEGMYVSRWKRIPTAPWGTVFGDKRTDTVDEQGSAQLVFEHDFEDKLACTARLYYGNYRYDGDYVYDYSSNSIPRLVENQDAARGIWIGGGLDFVKNLGGGHRLVFGAEVQQNRKQDQYNGDVDGVYLDDFRGSAWYGAYVADEYTIRENLVLNAGVRHDRYSTFGSSINPRLGLIYNPFEKSTLKLIYGTAFRAPSAYELYYKDGGVQKDNPDLDPERIVTWEAVLEQDLGAGLKGSLSGFVNRIDDLIDTVLDPADGMTVFRNTGKARAQGMEAGLDGRWENGWRGRASWSVVNAENEAEGRRLTNSPAYLGKLNLDVPLLEEKIFAGIEFRYRSRVKTVGSDHASAYCLTNLTLFSMNLAGGLTVSATVYNLFDKKYGYPGGSEHVQDVILQDGRTYGLQVAYRF